MTQETGEPRCLDATDDPLHGHQEGRFFHGYYDGNCYLPLYIFCGRYLLAAKLRRANLDASAGAVEEVECLVRQIRSLWPNVRIVLRADRGFAREALMAWCEAHGVDYVFGLAKKARLLKQVEAECTRQNAITHTPNSRNGSSRSSPTKPEIVGVGNAEWSARPSTWKAAPTHTSS